MLKRFWFEFEFENVNDLPSGIGFGCGVTAYDHDDALIVLNKEVFKNKPMPRIKKVIENVDISTLDAGHVLPNMLPPNWRGVWWPRGYQFFK